MAERVKLTAEELRSVAESLDAVLAAAERDEVEASAIEQAYLSGAATALRAVANRSERVEPGELLR